MMICSADDDCDVEDRLHYICYIAAERVGGW